MRNLTTAIPTAFPAAVLVLSLSAAWGSDAKAHEPKQGDVWAVIGPVGYRTKGADQVPSDAPVYGLGLSAEGDVDYNGGVEIAMIYVDKSYQRRRHDDLVVETIKRMYITTGYRHWFFERLSAGFAFFSSYSMGDPKVSVDSRPSGDELLTTARDITEYGLDYSLQWEAWRQGDIALLADARYSQSLSRKSHEQADLLSVALGFKYLVPKR